MYTLDDLLAAGIDGPLRESQIGSLKMLRGFLRSRSEGAALVHLPAGAGKSGVIALASRALVGSGAAVVVCPRRAIRDQLAYDIEAGFLETIGRSDAFPIAGVQKLTPSDAKRVEFEAGWVYVLTVQSLVQLRSNSLSVYRELGDIATLAVFDEGHYEPSRAWSLAIRDLGVPTVLASATPFRNDLLAFDIDVDHTYSYQYCQAVEDGYLRPVDWHDDIVPADAGPDTFAEAVVEFTEGHLGACSGVADAKVMVRCGTAEGVEAVAQALLSHSESVVAVHHSFDTGSGDEPWRFRHVPDVRAHDARYWVHQYKLLEGVDEPRFALIALYDPFGDARSVVQQVGRVLRVAAPGTPERAQVITRGATQAKRQWDSYLRFDKSSSSIDDSFAFLQLSEKGGADSMSDLFGPAEKWIYSLGDFRREFNPDHIEPKTDLLIATTTRVCRADENFSAEQLAIECQKAEGRNRIQLKQWPFGETTIYLWISFEESPITSGFHFADRTLGYTITRSREGLVFYADSEGWTPDHLRNFTAPLERSRIERAIPTGNGTRLVEVSLANTDLGSQAVRSKTLRSSDLAASSVALNDHAHAPMAARMRSPANAAEPETGTGRVLDRYIGIARGRVTDRQKPLPLSDYLKWLDDIDSALANNETEQAILGRYAAEAAEPDDSTPRNILLDFDHIRDSWIAEFGELQVDDTCCSIDCGLAETTINDAEVSFSVAFDDTKKSYKLTLESSGPASDTPLEQLFQRLTSEQAFRVVPASLTHLYAYGSWYQPAIGAHSSHNEYWQQFLGLFFARDELAQAHSEKGKSPSNGNPGLPANSAQGWHPETVFHLFDRDDSPICPRSKWTGLICDDGGRNEIADFIAYSPEKNAVSLAHLKAHSAPKPKSASALAEVTSQAVKNLRYLSPYDQTPPPNKASSWDQPWNHDGIGPVPRLRRHPQSKDDVHDLWDQIRKALSNPLTSREIWIVIGGGFSKDGLKTRLAQNSLTPEDVQLFYLVTTTWASANAGGTALKIFTSP